MTAPVDPDALLCALILAPRTWPRNRYFSLFEDATLRRVRRRAARIRGIVRQLALPGPDGAEITGEQVLGDGRLLIRYRVKRLALNRTAAMSPLEAATMRYALHRAERAALRVEDREMVEKALERLGTGLTLRAMEKQGSRASE